MVLCVTTLSNLYLVVLVSRVLVAGVDVLPVLSPWTDGTFGVPTRLSAAQGASLHVTPLVYLSFRRVLGRGYREVVHSDEEIT